MNLLKTGKPTEKMLTENDFSRHFNASFQICPGLNANDMHALSNKHHKVSSLLKVNLNIYNSVKYEVV